MNLYLMSQSRVTGYDTFDSVVVSAKSEQDAREIHPSRFVTHHNGKVWMGTYRSGEVHESRDGAWVPFEEIHLVNVEYLGKTRKPRGVILASFNAG